jgi:hypothetical protein
MQTWGGARPEPTRAVLSTGKPAQPEKEINPAQPGFCSAAPAQVAICRPGLPYFGPTLYIPAQACICRPGRVIIRSGHL